jgi:hypothetical protein
MAYGVALLMLCGCVIKPPQAERTVDGLQRKPSKRVDVVYTAPGMSLATYRRIVLDPVDVAFKKNWQRAHPEVTAADIERIRTEAAALFRHTFAQELDAKGGYELVEAAAPDVFRVSASIVDLDLAAPGGLSSGTARTYVVSLGDMTLLGELRDSVSGAILVRVADRERGREFGNLRLVNNVSASAEAGRAFAMWAGLLREALDAAKSPSMDE